MIDCFESFSRNQFYAFHHQNLKFERMKRRTVLSVYKSEHEFFFLAQHFSIRCYNDKMEHILTRFQIIYYYNVSQTYTNHTRIYLLFLLSQLKEKKNNTTN